MFSICLFFTTINCSGGSFVDLETSAGNRIVAGIWNTTPTLSSIISGLSTPTASNDAKTLIKWNTDIPSTTNVEIRTDTANPWILVLPEDTAADNTVHSKEIPGLFPLTTYYFRVKSKSAFGNETISPEQHFETGQIRLGSIMNYADVVINEFLPNPIGNDNAAIPNGEWIELFNRSFTSTYEVSGWYLTDYDPSHRLNITLQNTISSDPTTSGLILGPQEFLVVYRNGNNLFSLNNDAAGDQVNLYNTNDDLVDSQDYNSGLNDTVLENKSFARFPDGSDYWFDPIPTAGKTNRIY